MKKGRDRFRGKESERQEGKGDAGYSLFLTLSFVSFKKIERSYLPFVSALHAHNLNFKRELQHAIFNQ